jgi:hypothetical protein
VNSAWESFASAFHLPDSLPGRVKADKPLPVRPALIIVPLWVNEDYSALPGRIMAEEHLLVKSRGKKKGVDKDLRPGIYKITVTSRGESVIIKVWVNVGEPVNIRYDELKDILIAQGVKPESIVDIYRSGNYIRVGTDFYSPLEKVS